MKTLLLAYNSLAYEDIDDLASGLRENEALAHLRLNGNSLGVEGTETLVEALKQNRTLRTLEVKSTFRGKGNHFSHGEDCAKAYGLLLKADTGLQELYLDDNCIWDTFTYIIDGVAENEKLSMLSLANNGITTTIPPPENENLLLVLIAVFMILGVGGW